jgi:hypothetical protein
MAIVQNDTGVWQTLDGHTVAPGDVCECTEVEATNLSRCGWVIVSGGDRNGDRGTLTRIAGKRGALLESTSPYMPLETYYKDSSIGLPKPTKPYEYGRSLVYPMACNDSIGDCTVAGIVHLAQVAALICGVKYVYPGDAVVKSFYYGLTGGQDTGLQLSQVISAVSKPNPLGFELCGAATVNTSDYALMSTVCWNFGGLYLAADIPESSEDDFERYLPWRLKDPPEQPIGGHCFVGNGVAPDLPANNPVNTKLLDIVTWGATTECTVDWWQYYGIQAYVLLFKWFVTSGHDAIQHLDDAQMLADLRQIQSAR